MGKGKLSWRAPPTLFCVTRAAGLSKSTVCSLPPGTRLLVAAFLGERLLQGCKRLSWKFIGRGLADGSYAEFLGMNTNQKLRKKG